LGELNPIFRPQGDRRRQRILRRWYFDISFGDEASKRLSPNSLQMKGCTMNRQFTPLASGTSPERAGTLGRVRRLLPALVAIGLVSNSCESSSLGDRATDAEAPSADALALENELIAQAAVGPTEAVISEVAAVRFLNRATFGATPADIARVQTLGFQGWLNEQMATSGKTQFSNMLAVHNAYLAEDSTRTVDNISRITFDWSTWQSYLTANDQLRKRVGYALSQIMVVGLPGLASAGRERTLMAAAYLDWLEKNAFGNFKDLLRDVSLSPAMGYYLSHRNNRKADYPQGDTTKEPTRVPDENYAREVMQLFSIGLYRLKPDGELQLNAAGKPIESYTESDVQNLARVFTGWRWATRDEATADPAQKDPAFFTRMPMKFEANRHSPEPKVFLDESIAANVSGPLSLERALDALVRHPNTAPFIAKQLIQRLVTSNPRPEYVARVAAKFVDNGQGVRGDMKAVVSAILLDPDAFNGAAAGAELAGKLREPVLRFTAFARAFGVQSSGPIWRIDDLSDAATELAQSPLQSVSVFNFYRPGYTPPNTTLAARNKVAPEFQITTDTSIPGYVNFIQGQLRKPKQGIVYGYASLTPLAATPAALALRVSTLLGVSGSADAATVKETTRVLEALPATTDAQKLERVRVAILLNMVSSDFLVQH
jgi:uncharacterized protein (DUF1800 family)